MLHGFHDAEKPAAKRAAGSRRQHGVGKRRLLACVVATTVLTAACEGPTSSTAKKSAREVFAVQHNFAAHWHASTADILDLGVPALHNLTDHQVDVLQVSMVDRPSAVHVLGVTAYNYRESGGGVISQIGDLSRDCPKKYVPHPVEAAVTPPRSDSAWFLVIAFQVSHPGTYHLDKLRIDYADASGRGWQYQNVNTTLSVQPATTQELTHRRKTACSAPVAAG